MHAPQIDRVVEVLDRVKTWPPDERRDLAQRILQTLPAEPAQPSGKAGLRALLGLARTEGPPPSDEECRRILEEELLKKYGR